MEPIASGLPAVAAGRGEAVDLEGGARGRQGQVGGADLDAVTAGVLGQRVGRVEPHGLGVEQGGAERGRVVPLEPRRRVDQVGEAHRVALGEAVAGERGQLLPHPVGHLPGDAALGHAVVEPLAQPFHALEAALGAHGLAQLVGLAGREPGDVDGDLHELLLEQGHAQGLAQGLLHERVRVGDRLQLLAAPDVGVHRPALDRPGADERHLDHQVVERLGPQPGQRGHLRPRLDLEHAHRVGPAQHGVDLGVLAQEGEVDLVPVGRPHEVDAVVQRLEHAEAQQVELHETDRGAVVLVPLEHGAQRHRGVVTGPGARVDRGAVGAGQAVTHRGAALEPAPLDRAHLDDGPVADDHAPRVDAQVPRRPLDLAGQRQHGLGDVVAVRPLTELGGRGRHGRPHVHLLRPGVLLARRVAERLGHVAHGRAGPVADDVGHLGRVLAPVAAVHVLDGLFPPPALYVDVDVGGAVALGRQEPLEQQVERHRVGVGDAEGVADRRVGRAAPALAVDLGPLAELDDVPHHEEVAGEPQRLDDGELVVDLGPGLAVAVAVAVGGGAAPGAVTAGAALLHQAAQVAHLVEPVGARERRQLGRHQRQVERACTPQLGRQLDRPRPPGEAAGLLVARAQVGATASRQPAGQVVEAAPGPHRGHGGGEPAPGGHRVVDVVGGHQRQARPHGERGQGVVAGRVERVAVVAQLDHHVVGAERVDQPGELAGGGRRPVLDQRLGHRPLAAPGEHQPVAAVDGRPVDARVVGLALLAPGQVPGADGRGQPGVALGVAGQHQQVVAPGVGLAVLRAGEVERQLGPEHGRHPHGPGRLREADDAVEPVVVGDGQRLEAEARGLLGQLLGVTGPVEEAEVRVAVQLGVGGGADVAVEPLGRDVGGPVPRPGRAVAAVGPLGAVGVARSGLAPGASVRPPAAGIGAGPPARERALDLAPRDVGVVEAHAAECTNVRS